MADNQDAIELKRRARRRLVGAIALVVFVVIALPIVLDNEPKPISQDLTIQIPSQDASKFATRVLPAQPDPVPAPTTPPTPPAVHTEADPAAKAAASSPAKAAAVPDAPKAALAVAAPEVKSAPPAAPALSTKPEATAKPVANAPKESVKEAVKDAVKEPAKAPPAESGKVPAKAAATPTPAPASAPAAVSAADAKSGAAKADRGFAVPLGLFSKADNIKQVRGKATAVGIKTYTEAMAGSERVRVRAGPFPNRDAAEKAREKLKGAGLDVGAVVAR